LFIHQFHGHLGDLLAIMINPSMNVHVQVSVGTYFFISFEYIPMSGISGSYGKVIFNILRNCQTVFQSGCTIFPPAMWGPFSLDMIVFFNFYFIIFLRFYLFI